MRKFIPRATKEINLNELVRLTKSELINSKLGDIIIISESFNIDGSEEISGEYEVITNIRPREDNIRLKQTTSIQSYSFQGNSFFPSSKPYYPIRNVKIGKGIKSDGTHYIKYESGPGHFKRFYYKYLNN